MLFGAQPSQRIEWHLDSRRCARRGERKNDATENVKNVVATDTPYYMSGLRVLEAAGVDFGGRVVVLELLSRADSGLALAAPAVSSGNMTTSCCFLFEKNIFAIELMIPLLMSNQI